MKFASPRKRQGYREQTRGVAATCYSGVQIVVSVSDCAFTRRVRSNRRKRHDRCNMESINEYRKRNISLGPEDTQIRRAITWAPRDKCVKTEFHIEKLTSTVPCIGVDARRGEGMFRTKCMNTTQGGGQVESPSSLGIPTNRAVSPWCCAPYVFERSCVATNGRHTVGTKKQNAETKPARLTARLRASGDPCQDP